MRNLQAKRIKGPGNGGEAGFTLLELLIAIVVLGLIFGMLSAGLGFGIAAWERGQVSADAESDLRLTQSFLRRQIEGMLPLRLGRRMRGKIAMRGRASELTFVTRAPYQLKNPGYFQLSFRIVPETNGNGLQIGWRQLRPDLADFRPDGRFETVTLLDEIVSAKFDYFGSPKPDAAPRWFSSWEKPDRLPDLVRLTVEFAPESPNAWPPFIATPVMASER